MIYNIFYLLWMNLLMDRMSIMKSQSSHKSHKILFPLINLHGFWNRGIWVIVMVEAYRKTTVSYGNRNPVKRRTEG